MSEPQLIGSFFVLVLNIYLAGCYASEPVSVSDDYKDLQKAALSLKKAVLTKDYKSLKIAAPFYSITESDDDLPDNILRFLYKAEYIQEYRPEARSVFEVLKSQKKTSLLFEKYGAGSGARAEVIVRVYFYDPSVINLALPLSIDQSKDWLSEYVTCRFKKINGEWKVAYALFDSETEGP